MLSLWTLLITSKIKFKRRNQTQTAKVNKRDLEGAQGAQPAAEIHSMLLPFSASPVTENMRNGDI